MRFPTAEQRLTRLREDAGRGEARAQRLLALRYQRGRGVSRDEILALRWMRRAAEQGFVLAVRGLGEFLEQGVGCEPDLGAAASLYRLAGAHGDPVARQHLKRLGRER